jgi:hypothetical protein
MSVALLYVICLNEKERILQSEGEWWSFAKAYDVILVQLGLRLWSVLLPTVFGRG